MSVLAVEGLQAWYRTGTFGVPRDVRAVDGLSVAVEAGEFYGLAGDSSSGGFISGAPFWSRPRMAARSKRNPSTWYSAAQ